MNLIGQTKILRDYGRNEIEILISTFSKFYNPLENEVFVSFKRRVIFRQYILKKCKHFGIKIF